MLGGPAPHRPALAWRVFHPLHAVCTVVPKPPRVTLAEAQLALAMTCTHSQSRLVRSECDHSMLCGTLTGQLRVLRRQLPCPLPRTVALVGAEWLKRLVAQGAAHAVDEARARPAWVLRHAPPILSIDEISLHLAKRRRLAVGVLLHGAEGAGRGVA